MGKDLYLNDVPVDVFLDYFDKTTYAEENVNEQVWEESDAIVLSPDIIRTDTETDEKYFEIRTVKSKKIENHPYIKIKFNLSNNTVKDFSTESLESISNNYIKLKDDNDTIKLEENVIKKINNFNFSKLESLFDCKYNKNYSNTLLEVAVRVKPYNIPKVNDKSENIYRDPQGLLTTKKSYDNNFFTHQKAIRKTFAGLIENNSWMYRCKPRTLSILSDKGIEYLAYYDQCIKTTKYETIAEDSLPSETPVSSLIIPKKATTGKMDTRELLKIENRIKNLSDYPVYSVYSTAKEAKLLEAPTSFYIEDKRYICRESGFYDEGIENPEYIYKLNSDREKIELPNKNVYFMNSEGFYYNDEKLEYKENSEIIFNKNIYTYQEPGFYTKYKDTWTKKLGLKTGVIVNFNSDILTYYNGAFFKLNGSSDQIYKNSKELTLINRGLYHLSIENNDENDKINEIEKELKTSTTIDDIIYNDIDSWTLNSSDYGDILTQNSIPLIHTATKIKKPNSDRVYEWNGISYESIIDLENVKNDILTTKFLGKNFNIDFEGKKLYQVEHLKYTTVVEKNGRTYRFDGTNFVTAPLTKYLPKNIKVQYDGEEYEWTGKKLKRLLIITVKPELDTQIIYNNKSYTWNGSSWGINIPNKSKVKYNGDKNWKWYSKDKKLDKLFKIAKKPETSTVVSYSGLNYKWNGSNFVMISKDDATLNNNETVKYKGLNGWKYNSINKSISCTVTPTIGILGIGATMIEYEGKNYYFGGDTFRTIFWNKLPENAVFTYKGITGWIYNKNTKTFSCIKTAEYSHPITVIYKDNSYTWTGDTFESDISSVLHIPHNATVFYNGLGGWVWSGKTLTNTIKFYNGLTLTHDNVKYIYNSKKNIFINKEIILKKAVSKDYEISQNGEEYIKITDINIDTVDRIPKLPSVVIRSNGKKVIYSENGFIDEDKKLINIEPTESLTYLNIPDYRYENGFLTRTIELKVGDEISYKDIEYTYVGSKKFKIFSKYQYSKIGSFYNKEGYEFIPSRNTTYYLKNGSNIYKHRAAGFYNNEDVIIDFNNGDKIKSNTIEYIYFKDPGFYYHTNNSTPNKLDLVPGMTILDNGKIYIYRIGWLFYKDKYRFNKGDIITFKDEKYTYETIHRDYKPAFYFYDNSYKKQLKPKHGMILKKEKEYFIYHEDDKCFYKRSPISLGSIIYSPELIKRNSSLSENIFPGNNPQPEMVLLNVYDRTFKIKNKTDWKLKLNDDNTVYVYHEITDKENKNQLKKEINQDDYKNYIFDIKSNSPYLLLPIFSNHDSLTGIINKYLHIEIPASESPENKSTLILNGKITGDSLNASSVKLNFGSGEFEASVLLSNEIGMSEEQKEQIKDIEEYYFVKIDLEKIECNLCRQLLCEVSKAKETKIEEVKISKVYTRFIKKISYRSARTIIQGLSKLFFSLNRPIIEKDTYTEVVCKSVPIIANSDTLYRITDYFKMDFSNEPIEKFYNLQNPSQDDINDFLEFGKEKLENPNLKLEGSIFKEVEYFENYYSLDKPYIKRTTTYQFLKSSSTLVLDDPNDTVLSENLEWNLKYENGTKLISSIILPKVTEVAYKNELYKWDGENFINSNNKYLNKNTEVSYVKTDFVTNINNISKKSTTFTENGITYYWNGLKYINTRDIRENIDSAITFANIEGWSLDPKNNVLSVSNINLPNNSYFNKIKLGSDEFYNILYKSNKFYQIADNIPDETERIESNGIYKKILLWDGKNLTEKLIPSDENVIIKYNGETYTYDPLKNAFIAEVKHFRVRTILKTVFNGLRFLLRSNRLQPISLIETYTTTKKLKNNIFININEDYYRYINGILIRNIPTYEIIEKNISINGIPWNSNESTFLKELSTSSVIKLEFNGIPDCSYNNGKISKEITDFNNIEFFLNSMQYKYDENIKKFVTKDIIENNSEIINESKITQILVNNKTIYSYDGINFVNEKNELLKQSDDVFEIIDGYKFIFSDSINKINKKLYDTSNKSVELVKPERFEVYFNKNKYIWDGVYFISKNEDNLENGDFVQYLTIDNYKFIIETKNSKTEFRLVKEKIPSLPTRINVSSKNNISDGVNYDWDGEKFVKEEVLSKIEDNSIIIMSTYENGWNWDPKRKELINKDGRHFVCNRSTMIVYDEKIYYFNGSSFVRKVEITDEELSSKNIIYNESSYSWDGLQLISLTNNSYRITPTLATTVFYKGLTYEWDGYNFSFGELDRYPCTKEKPEFNNLDVEGLPITKETIQQRYNHSGRYFVNEVSRLRGDYIPSNIFFKDRVTSLTKMLKNIIENDENEIQLKTESMKSNGFTNLYNYCQGLNNFVKKDVMLVGEVQIPERVLINPKEIYTKLILEKIPYTILNKTSLVNNVANSLIDQRLLLERLIQYKMFPANFMYENYLNSIKGDFIKGDFIHSNINIIPGYEFEKQRHIKNYHNETFDFVLDNVFNELKEFVRNGDKEKSTSKNNLNNNSDYFKTFYESKFNHFKRNNSSFEEKYNNTNITSKKVFTSSKDEIDLLLLDLIMIDNDNIWEVLYGNIK